MGKNIIKKNIPMLNTKAAILPSTINSKERTVEAIITSTLPVDSFSWSQGEFKEILSMLPSSIRQERLSSGAMPVLNNHGTAFFGGVKDLSDVIGQIRGYRIDGENLIATLAFPDTPDVETIWRKIETGFLKNISIGYRVYKYKDETGKETGSPKVMRAIDWEPFEASVVAIPADYSAQMRKRSNEESLNEVEIVSDEKVDEPVANEPPKEIKEESSANAQETQEEISEMPKEVIENAEPVASSDPAKIEEAAKKEGVEQERSRILEIGKAVKAAKLDDKFASELIAKGVSINEARKQIIDMWSQKDATEIQGANPSITVTRDADETFRKSAGEALLHRADPGKHKLTELGKPVMGYSFKELARLCVERSGVKTGGMSQMEIVKRAFHSTSDFPSILADAINKTLRQAYEESPRTFLPWAKRGSAPDFKNINRTQLGNFPSLTKVLEGGEIEYKTVADSKESYQLATYAGMVAVTRQAVINDDLSAFSRLAAGAGIASAALESDIVYSILTANAALADSLALFEAATHKNFTSTGTAISVNSLGVGRAAMRKQKAGSRVLNLRPGFLLVPAALETIGQQFLNQGIVPNIVPATSLAVNPFQNSMSLIVEPRLDDTSATAWYLVAGQGLIDTVEYCYLEGNEGVFTETEMGFDVDGIRVKARHDFAAKAIDFRGLYLNNGA